MFSHFRNFIQQCEKKKYLFLPVSGEPMKFNNCFGWIFNKLLNFSLGEKFWNFDICSLKNSWSLLFQSRKGPVECSYAWKLVSSCTRTLLKFNLTIFLTKKIKKSPWHKGCFHLYLIGFVSTRNAIGYHHHYRHHHNHQGLYSLLAEEPLLGLIPQVSVLA